MSDRFSQPKRKLRDRNWTGLNLCLLVLILVGVALPLTYKSLGVVKEKEVQDRLLAELEKKRDRARIQNQRLSREVQLAVADPEYQETLARDHGETGHMKKGEVIFRIMGGGPSAQ